MLYWIIEEIFRMEERKMEKKLEKRLEVSYVYDPVGGTLDCDVIYDVTKDSFCAMFDEYLTCETIHEFINGFVQYLRLREKQ